MHNVKNVKHHKLDQEECSDNYRANYLTPTSLYKASKLPKLEKILYTAITNLVKNFRDDHEKGKHIKTVQELIMENEFNQTKPFFTHLITQVFVTCEPLK